MSEVSQNRALQLASIAVVVLVVTVGLLTMLWNRHAEQKPQAPPHEPLVHAVVVEPTPAPVRTLHPAADGFAKKLTLQTESPEEDLLMVQQLLLLYHRSLGENPEGDNEDVVAALLGQNKQNLAFLPEGVESIREGRLMDRWGTPYFMHPESVSHMSLRSAGPDKHLFTDDDVVLE